MKELKIGTTLETRFEVTGDKLASIAGSGTLDIFATPFMIAYMELTALRCVEPYLDEGETTVGTNVNVNHIAPAGLGETVYFTATLALVDRRRLVFNVSARTASCEIGNGTHERFVINTEKFMKKLAERS